MRMFYRKALCYPQERTLPIEIPSGSLTLFLCKMFPCRSGARRAKRKQHQKDAQWIEQSLWACVGRVVFVAETRLRHF